MGPLKAERVMAHEVAMARLAGRLTWGWVYRSNYGLGGLRITNMARRELLLESSWFPLQEPKSLPRDEFRALESPVFMGVCFVGWFEENPMGQPPCVGYFHSFLGRLFVPCLDEDRNKLRLKPFVASICYFHAPVRAAVWT